MTLTFNIKSGYIAIAHPLSTNTKYAIDMLDWFEEG